MKSKHSSKAVEAIMHDYHTMVDPAEFEKLYDVQLNDGSVTDLVYNKTFDTVAAWAEFSVEQDNEDDFEYKGKNFKSSADDYW